MRRIPIRSILLQAIPLIFIFGMVLFFPWRYIFEFNPDEGINVIKAMLNIQGYQLYSEIWSDQPPLFTLLLTQSFRIFGLSIPIGRGLVLLFSAGILWLTIQYLRLFFGDQYALFGTLVVLLLPYYLVLSVSIMIGLPAIALALLAFFGLAMWHKKGGAKWLVLSGFALGLSIMIKLFTIILTPVFFSGIVLSGWMNYRQHRDWLKAIKPSLIWLSVLLVTIGSILILIVKPVNVSHLLQVHLAAGDSFQLKSYVELRTLIYFSRFKDSAPVLILAFFGCISAYRSKSWTAMYLGAWVAAGSVLLWVNVPFWHHQQLLVTIPAAILATIAIGDAYSRLRNFRRSEESKALAIVMFELSLILAVTYLLTRLAPAVTQLDLGLPNFRTEVVEMNDEQEILALMRDHAEDTQWVYTDRPMFAFRAQLPVPPHLAVISMCCVLL